MIWNIRKQKTTNQNNKKNKGSQKSEDSISSLWNKFKRSNICVIWVWGEEKEQEIGNLFEKILKEKFPHLSKEIDMEVQDVQRIPNRMETKRSTPRHIIIKMPKFKDKERILKAGREKQLSYLRRSSHKTVSWFFKRNFAG